MNLIRMATLPVIALAACLAASTCVYAQAPAYPSRPVKLVVPYPTGGGTDITARAIAKPLSEALGQSVVIENKPGATGMIGAQNVVSSAADGYTVLFGAASEMAMNASLFKKMPYNPRSDLQPVALVATFPLILVTASSNTTPFEKMLERSKGSQGAVSYGSIGYGSPQHLAGELLQMESNAVLTHVPYKGSGPLIQDGVAGHVEIAISSLPPAVPLVKGGQLRALAVTSQKRSNALPRVPTMAELGFPSYDLATWVGVSVPAATPRPIVARLNEALLKALGDKEFRETLMAQGAETEGSTPEQFRDFIGKEIAKSDRIVSKARIQLD